MESTIALITAFLSVYALAFVHFLAAIPTGLALGLPPLLVMLSVASSYITSTALILYFGDRARLWIMRRFRLSMPDENSRVYHIWQRYGVVGYGFTTPLTVGAQLGAIIGITLQADSRRLFLWMTIGAIAWALLITSAVNLGVISLQAATGA